VSTGTKVNKDL